VAVGLLAWLVRRVGGSELVAVLRDLRGGWLAAALFLFLPITLLTASRWRTVAAGLAPISLGDSLRMVLAASAANLMLPAKLGDVGKGAFLPGADGRAGGLALALFEKLADVAALAACMLLAALFAPPEREAELLACAIATGVVTGFAVLCAVPLASLSAFGSENPVARAARGVSTLRAHPRRLLSVLGSSLLLWSLHLLQFQLAAWAAGATADPAVLASRIPMAIFVGLLPLSFAGIGTRDAALLYLLAPWLGEPVALALGAFATLRYLVPAAAGIFFLGSYRGAPVS
jgi:uncharacterized membrane protein YbhN (UPF0104 family)